MERLDDDSELIEQEVQGRLLSEARAQVLYYARQLDALKSTHEKTLKELRSENAELRTVAQHWVNFSESRSGKLFSAYVAFNRTWLGMPLRICRRVVRKITRR